MAAPVNVPHAYLGEVAKQLHRKAAIGTFGGERDLGYLTACTISDMETKTRLILTRDVEYHAQRWMLSPLHERCLHLTLAPIPDLAVHMPRGMKVTVSPKLEHAWLEAVFGSKVPLLWGAQEHAVKGQLCIIRHWRLFCNERWEPGAVNQKELREKKLFPAEAVFPSEAGPRVIQ